MQVLTFTDWALALLSPVVLAGMGVWVTLRPQNPRRHFVWIGCFLAISLIAAALSLWQTAQSKKDHANEVKALREQLDDIKRMVHSDNVQISEHLKLLHQRGQSQHFQVTGTEHLAMGEHTSSVATTTHAVSREESQRRQEMLSLLKWQYILSRGATDPEILAGRKAPPIDWINQRLKELKEPWVAVLTDKPGELGFKELP